TATRIPRNGWTDIITWRARVLRSNRTGPRPGICFSDIVFPSMEKLVLSTFTPNNRSYGGREYRWIILTEIDWGHQ
ncbi:hypothetical protein H8E88_19575, partial [candidate division KSB1 bacterium]|nr:hypothetical protein [candidate division KSB1 bacterium]